MRGTQPNFKTTRLIGMAQSGYIHFGLNFANMEKVFAPGGSVRFWDRREATNAFLGPE